MNKIKYLPQLLEKAHPRSQKSMVQHNRLTHGTGLAIDHSAGVVTNGQHKLKTSAGLTIRQTRHVP